MHGSIHLHGLHQCLQYRSCRAHGMGAQGYSNGRFGARGDASGGDHRSTYSLAGETTFSQTFGSGDTYVPQVVNRDTVIRSHDLDTGP